MEILKTLYYYLAYTMQFFRWLVVGRVAVLLLAGGRRNILIDFFIRFTQPLYALVNRLLPFTRVAQGKKETAWGLIDGLTPFATIALLWLLERAIRIGVSIIILNGAPPP